MSSISETFSRRRLSRAVLSPARRALRAVQHAAAGAASYGRTRPRDYRRYKVSDLLIAHRLTRRMTDGDAVLDVGCGNGHGLVELGMFRDLEKVGVDLAPPEDTGERLLPFDGTTLPFADASFDVSLVCYVLHHLSAEHAKRLFAEVVRVTRRRVLVIEDSLSTFGWLYRLRNLAHRLDADLEYAAVSPTYQAVGSEEMFLTHAQWLAWLRARGGVADVTLESLERLEVYAHHTLFDVELSPR